MALPLDFLENDMQAVSNVVPMRQRTQSREWLTPGEVGNKIKRTVDAVYKLIKRHRLPALRSGDGRYLIAIEDLEAFISARF